MRSSEKPAVSITAVWSALSGEEIEPKEYGWKTVRCVMPNHPDRTPTARINEDKGKFWCPACDASGDVFDLVKEVEGVDGFSAQIARVQEITGLSGEEVRGVSHSGSSYLPGRSRHTGPRRKWSPPWLSRRTGAGT